MVINLAGLFKKYIVMIVFLCFVINLELSITQLPIWNDKIN